MGGEEEEGKGEQEERRTEHDAAVDVFLHGSEDERRDEDVPARWHHAAG